jgi:hypothetical protein
MHGDGFLSGANAGAVEIECQDCHGTTKKYPWELPLGYGDEFNTTAATGDARGVTTTVAEYLKQGSITDPKDGYLLSARGNPLIHATKDGNKIIIHLASGKDITLKATDQKKKDPRTTLYLLNPTSNIRSFARQIYNNFPLLPDFQIEERVRGPETSS